MFFHEHEELLVLFILRIDLGAAGGGLWINVVPLCARQTTFTVRAHVEAHSQCSLENAHRSRATLHHEKPSQ